MKANIKADIIPLNEEFEAGKEVSNTLTLYDIDFPVNESNAVKKDFVKQLLSKQFTNLPSLYFRCQILHEGSHKPLFEYEDYYGEKPENRMHIKWEWDKKENIAIGVTYYPDGTIDDPRLLPDWKQTLEKHKKKKR